MAFREGNPAVTKAASVRIENTHVSFGVWDVLFIHFYNIASSMIRSKILIKLPPFCHASEIAKLQNHRGGNTLKKTTNKNNPEYAKN